MNETGYSPLLQGFIRENLGKPYLPGGRGPDSFDCWGVVTHLYSQVYGIELPPHIHLDVDNALKVSLLMEKGLRSWVPVESPHEGCLVALSKNKIIHHVGVYFKRRVLHCQLGGNVSAPFLHNLRSEGWKEIKFYVHRLHS